MRKKHPRGLWVLFFIEMWERFGFYIMMAIFVLYMDREFGWSDARKGDFYGGFLWAVYFLPILGGILGDRLLGQLNTIIIGSSCMFFGYIGLAFSAPERLVLFYLGLVLIAFGTGIFKVNMSVMIGNLYKDNIKLKDAGYNIYYMGVNIGAALAPLAATVISNVLHNYRASFAAAAVGMAISMIIQLRGRKSILMADTRHNASLLVSTSSSGDKTSIGNQTRQRILTLIILFAIVIFFWIAFYQNGFALTLFAERSTIKSDVLRPETYQFFNPFFILVLTPLLLAFFNHLNKAGREPSTPAKIMYGMIIMGCSMLIMVVASLLGGNMDENIMSPAWLISTYLIITLAEILISPMGQSFVSKVSPPRYQGLMMGLWFGATAMGGLSSGIFGKFYSDLAHSEYFLILVGLLFFAALLVLFAFKKLKRFGT